MEIQIEPTITKELILQRLSQEAIMEHYLGVHVGKGLFCSPLRKDENPTCAFFKNKRGDLIFKDFRGDFYGNCFNLVMYKYRCSFHKALQIIANDFGIIHRKDLKKHEKLIEYSGNILKETESCILQAQIQPFTKKELEWWKSYGVEESTLSKFNVYSCKSVFLNGGYFTSSSPNNFIFGYYYGSKNNMELWRMYFPFRTRFRFLSNWPSKLIQGSKQLPESGDLCVITKSMKDVMCLYGLGITAIAPNSENLFLTEEQYEVLKRKFKVIVVFYDNDSAGISNMFKIKKKFGCHCLFIPKHYGAKDISDFYKKYGKDKTIELINDGIQWLNTRLKNLSRKNVNQNMETNMTIPLLNTKD